MANFGTFKPDRASLKKMETLREPVNASESPSTSSVTSTYEELLKGCVPCPTCRGSGKVEAELEAQLVSFLPVNDERLRPRTKLKVCFAFALCALITSMVIAFLLPRSVTVSSSVHDLTPVNASVNEKLFFMNLPVQYWFNISNSNFYAVTVNYAGLDGLFDRKKICHGMNRTSVRVPMRSTFHHMVVMNVTFTTESKGGLYYCQYAGRIPMEFDLAVTVHYLTHTEKIGLVKQLIILCPPMPNYEAV